MAYTSNEDKAAEDITGDQGFRHKHRFYTLDFDFCLCFIELAMQS